MNVFTLILVFPVCNRDSSVRLRDAELLHHTHSHTHTHTHTHTQSFTRCHILPNKESLSLSQPYLTYYPVLITHTKRKTHCRVTKSSTNTPPTKSHEHTHHHT